MPISSFTDTARSPPLSPLAAGSIHTALSNGEDGGTVTPLANTPPSIHTNKQEDIFDPCPGGQPPNDAETKATDTGGDDTKGGARSIELLNVEERIVLNKRSGIILDSEYGESGLSSEGQVTPVFGTSPNPEVTGTSPKPDVSGTSPKPNEEESCPKPEDQDTETGDNRLNVTSEYFTTDKVDGNSSEGVDTSKVHMRHKLATSGSSSTLIRNKRLNRPMKKSTSRIFIGR